MNVAAFFISLVVIAILAGVIYALIKLASKVGTFIIPILCALIIGVINAKAGRGFDQLFNILISGIVVVLGVIGTLMCSVYAELFDLSRGVKVLSETKEDSEK